jgi:hypothetical protein
MTREGSMMNIEEMLREARMPLATEVTLGATNPTVNGLNGVLTLFAAGTEEAAYCDYDLLDIVLAGVAYGPTLFLGRN